MKLVARVWIGDTSVFFSYHAADRYRQRCCAPADAQYHTTAALRRVVQATGRISMEPPKGIQIGLDLRDQILTEGWLTAEDGDVLLVFPFTCKPGGGGYVATTCMTVPKPQESS